MRSAHFGPEFTYATGHAVSVIVQFAGCVQRDDVAGVGGGKSAQVLFLPAGDRLEDLLDELQVGRREPLQQTQARFTLFQQQPLGRRTLLHCQRAKLQLGVVLAPDSPAEGVQRIQPLLERDERRVRDRVAGAREQIGQADLRTDASRQHPQCQVERARDVLQHIRG